jgi:hypothetical protein
MLLSALAAAAASVTLPVDAQVTYTVNVTQELNGLDIKIEPVPSSGVLVVNLTNNGQQKVKCTVKFEADPQVPSRSYVFVDPGKSSSATLRATQKWFEVDVDVSCKADD